MDRNIFIEKKASMKDALKKLGKTGNKTLLVVDKKERLLGTVTDGDIRRHILKGKGLECSILGLYNKKPIYISKDEYSLAKARKMLVANKIELVPIVDAGSRIVDFLTWQKAFSEGIDSNMQSKKLDIPVVIMAGGKGTRLEPFSNIFPKALIPLGEKPIIEIIIDDFRRKGISKYFLSLNHKAEMIESYFNSIKKDYSVTYVREGDFLGTAGSLKLLEKKIADNFIVSNCDVMVKADIGEVVDLHKRKKSLLTVLSSIQHFKMPYGVIEFKKGGAVTGMHEKPEYTVTINAGMYIMNKEALKFIPKNKVFDMTDLIRTLIVKNKTVSTYPVNENDYIDIGQLEEYRKVAEKIGLTR